KGDIMSFKRFAPFLAAFFLFSAASVGAAAENGSAGTTVDPSQVKELQERMIGDQGIMTLIMALQNDPEMQSLLADPKLLAAAQAGDFGALLKDPRVRKFLDNPQVKEIGKRLDKKDAGGER
ncbi:MAG TPA: hypothetical protein VEM32_10890, partial [Geobacteraceae bacterium]|nr:hypothetical protein [Geobacteraceae bacterium]